MNDPLDDIFDNKYLNIAGDANHPKCPNSKHVSGRPTPDHLPHAPHTHGCP